MLTDLALEAFQKGPSLQKWEIISLYSVKISKGPPHCWCPRMPQFLCSCTAAELVTLSTKSCYVMTQGQVEKELGTVLLSGSVSVAITQELGFIKWSHNNIEFVSCEQTGGNVSFQFFATLHNLTYYLEYVLNSYEDKGNFSSHTWIFTLCAHGDYSLQNFKVDVWTQAGA